MGAYLIVVQCGTWFTVCHLRSLLASSTSNRSSRPARFMAPSAQNRRAKRDPICTGMSSQVTANDRLHHCRSSDMSSRARSSTAMAVDTLRPPAHIPIGDGFCSDGCLRLWAPDGDLLSAGECQGWCAFGAPAFNELYDRRQARDESRPATTRKQVALGLKRRNVAAGQWDVSANQPVVAPYGTKRRHREGWAVSWSRGCISARRCAR